MQRKEMASTYDPHSIQEGRYEWWVEKGYFKADSTSDKEPYSIVIPPPNVTGRLHLGHAWDTTIQDILTRMKRMQGYDVLWLPGSDHAGIATQTKVEEKLKQEGVSRHHLGREAFLDVTWKWAEEYKKQIREQWSKLGLGLDYSRERFTLDEGLSKAVRKVFVDLHQKGLIYRGEYIINWDTVAKTALSDIEVIHEEVKGALYHIRYPLSDGTGFIEVATTRPETLFGDRAIAVHPEDERYMAFMGKTVTIPMTDRKIPVISDEYVEKDFGSGALKITPAHDPNDFEVGMRHNLTPMIVMNEDGTMNEHAGQYNGLDRFECRKKLKEDLEREGLLVKVEEHLHAVGHSERNGSVVEPYLSKQWFVKMDSLAAKAVDAQKSENKVEFTPARFENTYLRWMENIRDWCISRQLWWGHQIPAWYHIETGEVYVGESAPSDKENWRQDEDVLDTWFSSALWAFSTLGFPDKTNPDYLRYYPNSVLVTGYDIIFFWVSRMIFQGLEFTKKTPFKNFVIHGLVRDEQGRKMSKSLGNGIDPMDIIAEYGADALRYTLSTGTSPGNDLRFTMDKVIASRNFANKVWNASRFAMPYIHDVKDPALNLNNIRQVQDKWILHRLNQTIASVTALMEKYELGEAGKRINQFIWEDFCDWYVELSKITLFGDNEEEKETTKQILLHVLKESLKLLHPFMPFITEEIWQSLPDVEESIVIAPWGSVDERLENPEAEEEMQRLVEVVTAVRNIRAEVNAPMSKKISMNLLAKNEDFKESFKKGKEVIKYFTGANEVVVATTLDKPEDTMTAVVSGAELFIPMDSLVDYKDELKRLKNEWEKMNKEVLFVESKLSNESFISRAPQKIVDEHKKKRDDYMEKRTSLEVRIHEIRQHLK